MRVLAIIPSDSILDYEQKGITWLEGYFNPLKYFDKVYVLSPLENHERYSFGITIRPVKDGYHFQKIIKEIKPDIIRAYGGYWAADFAVLNRINGIPILVSVHDTNPAHIHESLKYATHLICMTKAVQDAVIKKTGISINKINILGNRVDIKVFKKWTEEFEIRRIRELFPKGRMILHIGRKSKQKNLETLIKALKHLPDDHFCVFIGQGNLMLYKELAEESCVSERCFWKDSVENFELPKWYNACDLFCVLSRWEGFGLVFIEAAACETLILTSDISPMNEIFDSNNCFLEKNYEDPEKVAKTILSIFSMSDESLLSIKKNARNAAKKFDAQTISDNEIAIYEKVMAIKMYNDHFKYYLWRISFLIKTFYVKSKKYINTRIKGSKMYPILKQIQVKI